MRLSLSAFSAGSALRSANYGLAGWANSGYTAPALKAYFGGAHE